MRKQLTQPPFRVECGFITSTTVLTCQADKERMEAQIAKLESVVRKMNAGQQKLLEEVTVRLSDWISDMAGYARVRFGRAIYILHVDFVAHCLACGEANAPTEGG